MKTRDDAWFWMLAHVKFSRFDVKFMRNLAHQKLENQVPLTVKQAELWELLVYKYQRQIQESGQCPDRLLGLPWSQEPYQPVADHARAKIWIEDQEIKMIYPYSKVMVDAWRDYRSRVRSYEKYQDKFTWNPELKTWSSPLDQVTLKIYTEFARRVQRRQYQDIIFDSELTNIVNEIHSYGTAQHWRPTAELVGTQVMVSNFNEQLSEALPQNLTTGVDTLDKLVISAVEVGASIKQAIGSSYTPNQLDVICQRSSVVYWSAEAAEDLTNLADRLNWTVLADSCTEQEFLHLRHVMQQRLGSRFKVLESAMSPVPIEVDLALTSTYNEYLGRWYLNTVNPKRIVNYIDPRTSPDWHKINDHGITENS